MERYRNIGGNSGVKSFEIGLDNIIVQFNDGGTYLYNYVKPGAANVEHMKVLARSGHGLNSFISTIIKKNYAKKIR